MSPVGEEEDDEEAVLLEMQRRCFWMILSETQSSGFDM